MASRRKGRLICAPSLMMLACAARSEPGPAAVPELPAQAPAAPVIVEQEPEQILADEAIAAAVSRELAELLPRPECDPVRIGVEVERGIALLEGSVPSVLHAEVARERAETVRGVRGVVNHLRVPPVPISDEEIVAAVRARLEDDPALQGLDLEIASRLGRVRLSGSVASYTERDLAERTARAIRGVREVSSGIRVVPEPRADDEIRQDVVGRLATDAYLDDDSIEVEVERGVVRLSGRVGSFMEKRRAVTRAWVRGVSGVEGEQVLVDLLRQDREQRQARPRPPDPSVARAVRDAWAVDPAVSGAIDVQVQAGIAQLSGEVPSLRAKRAAERVAGHVVGVWRVESRIAVRPPEPGTDAALEERLRSRLFELSGASGVAIDVKDGRVSLQGALADPIQRAAVLRSVEATPGVIDVEGNLARRAPGIVRSDASIEREIERSLFWDSRVDVTDVDVDVQDGVAIVRGRVNSRAVHDAVLSNVARAQPRRVDDRLQLR